MKIDKRLNIVLEVERQGEPSVFVHSMPITKATYDQHTLILAQTVSFMYQKGIGAGICARIALNMMRRLAKDEDAAAGPAVEAMQKEVEQLLLPSIWQRTNMVIPTEQGWQSMPFQEVVDRKMLDDDDMAEVQNYLVFFTAASWVHMGSEVRSILYPTWQNSGARLTSLNSTEFSRSLPISKKPETTGENQPATASLPLV